MVDFGGWHLPVHYGSQMDEHHAVRSAAGMFDVSHMTVVDLAGEGVQAFLSRLLANDVVKLKSAGRALYTCMLNEAGGVIDDLIVYRTGEGTYRLVVNAATREQDLAWINRQADPGVSVTERSDLAMIAVQGPEAREALHRTLEAAAATRLREVRRFRFWRSDGDDLFVARTGYTGEDGYEVLLPAAEASRLWQQLAEAGVRPCGLGARDTLRLEAGLNLYGQDMDESTTPAEAGLQWTVDLKSPERRFIGREAVEAQLAAGVPRELVGIELVGRGVLRHGQDVSAGGAAGVVTSGSFSPTLKSSIALVRLPTGAAGEVTVDIRGRQVEARRVAVPFVGS